MFDLYTDATPNGYKISIALEELGLSYTVHAVDIRAGDQFTQEVVDKNPNAKIPILVDRKTGITVYESNAILMFLAAKTGRLFPRPEGGAYWYAVQLLFFQAASVGPTFGQREHFAFLAPETVPYGIRHFDIAANRLHGVIDALLAGRDYFLGNDYSIVDISHFGWIDTAKSQGEDIDTHANLKAWHERVQDRPAVQRGLAVPRPRDPSRIPRRRHAA